MKLRELVEKRDNFKAKREVYRQISIFLQEFVSADNREAKKSISIEGSDGQFVPDYIIEEILEEIEQSYLQPLENQIQEIEERAV